MKKCNYFEKQLVAYIHGELGERASRRLADHLESCAACRAELEVQRETLFMLGEALEVAPAPQELSPWRPLRRASHATGSRFEKIWYSPQLKSAVVACALTSLFFIISGSVVVFRILPTETEPLVVKISPEIPVDRENVQIAVNKRAVPKMEPNLRESTASVPEPELDGIYMPKIVAVNAPVADRTFDGFSFAREYRREIADKGRAVAEHEAEDFDWIAENSFKMAMDNPLSTFSMAVDQKAYANVRRFLNENRLPPPQAVRIEEMINYFSYDYPEPESGEPFYISLEVAGCPWNDEHQLAMVGLQGMKVDANGVLNAKKASVDGMDGTFQPIARDVGILIEFNPAQVKAYRLIGYENRLLTDGDSSGGRRDVGELGVGHAVTALYELIPAGSMEEIPVADRLKYQKTQLVDSNDLMTVKLRYKQPGSNESRLLVRSVGLADFKDHEPSANFRFVSEVAEFGLLLRNSEFKGNASYGRLIERAKAARGEDAEGCRAEFIRLVEKARLLDSGN